MRLSTRIRWLVVVLVLISLPIVYYNFILDWQNKPFCHKQFLIAFQTWFAINGKDPDGQNNEYPNVGGNSSDSLNVIRKEMGDYMDWKADYGYVPGLRQNDPGHLVLMYFNRPTRWTMHVLAPTIFEDKAWILVPVDFCIYGNGGSRKLSGGGECSERVSTDEFKQRLADTIDFIRTQKRPNWETIVAEQTKFLNSIDSLSR